MSPCAYCDVPSWPGDHQCAVCGTKWRMYIRTSFWQWLGGERGDLAMKRLRWYHRRRKP